MDADAFTRYAGHVRTTGGARLCRLWTALRQMTWGFLVFDTYHVVETEARHRQDAFDLLIMGDMLGIPLMNTTSGLRLLPYTVGSLPGLRTRSLSEHEVLDHAPHFA